MIGLEKLGNLDNMVTFTFFFLFKNVNLNCEASNLHNFLGDMSAIRKEEKASEHAH